jgi:primosomal replication protein N
MDSIKAQIAAVRQSCELVASALEVASVTSGPLDKVTDTSTLRRMMTCAMILDQEVQQLTEAGISHFQLILEQSHTTVEKIARVLRLSINQDVLLFLKESLEKITEVTDGALVNVLLLHLQVMVAVVRLVAGG